MEMHCVFCIRRLWDWIEYVEGGYMQVHVDASTQVAEGVVPVVESLLEQPADVWRTHRMLLQRDAEIALVQDGQLQSVAVVPSGLAAQQEDSCQPHIHQVGTHLLMTSILYRPSLLISGHAQLFKESSWSG